MLLLHGEYASKDCGRLMKGGVSTRVRGYCDGVKKQGLSQDPSYLSFGQVVS